MFHPQIKEPILYIFPFGSKVYGTDTEKSDEDYYVVVEGEEEKSYGIHEEEKNIHVVSDRSFMNMILKHDIAAMECIFSNETHYEFHLDLKTLRNSISAVVSNSFAKCRRKLRKGDEFDPYGAKKSLFHSLRILDFGIQIAQHGRIVDFKRMNTYFYEIMAMDSDEFEDYRKKYEPIGQKLKAKLKALAPLEKDDRKTKKGW